MTSLFHAVPFFHMCLHPTSCCWRRTVPSLPRPSCHLWQSFTLTVHRNWGTLIANRGTEVPIPFKTDPLSHNSPAHISVPQEATTGFDNRQPRHQAHKSQHQDPPKQIHNLHTKESSAVLTQQNQFRRRYRKAGRTKNSKALTSFSIMELSKKLHKLSVNPHVLPHQKRWRKTCTSCAWVVYRLDNKRCPQSFLHP